MRLPNKSHGKAITNSVLMTWMALLRKVALKISLHLTQKSDRLSSFSKRVWLIAFCVLGVGCSVWVIAGSFVNTNPPFQNHSIRLPSNVSGLSHSQTATDSLVTLLQYHRIKQFEAYLQRRQKDASGKRFYDSLLQVRPHLIDSLHMIDSLFLSQ